METRRAPHRGPTPLDVPEARPWALFFIVLAILALAGVPIVTSREIAEEERAIGEVLEPAQRFAAELALVQTRQMLRFREYLLTGDVEARVRYQDLLSDEESFREDLLPLLERMDVDVRQQALPLFDASWEWHLGHRDALASDTARVAFLDQAEADRTRYERMLLNSRVFRELINARMEAARTAAEDARRQQLQLTIALLALALLATVAVAVVGRRLRGIITEANLRRRDAVRARWEIDAVLEATGDGVLGVDLDGRLLTINATGSRLLGYGEEEARGRSLHDLLHAGAPEDQRHEPEDCPILAVLREEGGAESVDDFVWHRRGRRVPVRWALRPLMDGRVVRGAVLTLTDMTAVREAEEALREAVRAREETLAVVSHDLRNPLGSIAASAELLQEVSLGPDKMRMQLGFIQRAADRGNRLIDDLLDVSRIDAGVLAVRPARCAVGPLVDEAVAAVASRAMERSLDLHARIPADLPDLWADRDRMLQVLGNLLGNALRHTPQGGRIDVEAARTDDGDGVRLAVRDTGPGIPEEDQAHLFDRFWRRDRAARSGAGLGLAIVKGIVEAHGGHVTVESVEGEGSCFAVITPTVDSSRPATRGGASPGSS
ncbi:MAG: PAS domain-containing protein [Gemmatimonadetes bacterium]|nr:PAS domain-containing protein [Gemmatimonadota bacterium]